MSSNSPVLRVEGLQYQYDSQQLSFPDLSLEPGHSCALLGPSGCGKTTFLHLLAGLLTPQSGSVSVVGQSISDLPQRGRDRLRGEQIGIVLQQLRLIAALTVMENLLLAQRLAGQKQQPEHAAALLEQLGLGDKLMRRPSELSQGQAQRVAIARALMNRPAIILADEPTSSLDDHQAENVINLLVDIATSHNAALVVVTHDSRIRGRLDQELVLS